MWIHFKYERLPSFCFYCGKIGHADKFCEDMFDNPQGSEGRKYDSSLRAPLRKQGISKENTWIRGADGAILTPGRTIGKEKEDGSQKSDKTAGNGNYAKNNENPSKSGLPELMGIVSRGDKVTTISCVEPTNLTITNERREKDMIEMGPTGPSTIVSKKRRVVDPTTERPNNVVDSEDDVMIEIQKEGKRDPKNLLLTGAAMQARHES